MRAINNDRANELRWSRKGGLLMLDIARGLTFLHANKVCCPHSACHLVSQADTITGQYRHSFEFCNHCVVWLWSSGIAS